MMGCVLGHPGGQQRDLSQVFQDADLSSHMNISCVGLSRAMHSKGALW